MRRVLGVTQLYCIHTGSLTLYLQSPDRRTIQMNEFYSVVVLTVHVICV